MTIRVQICALLLTNCVAYGRIDNTGKALRALPGSLKSPLNVSYYFDDGGGVGVVEGWL